MTDHVSGAEFWPPMGLVGWLAGATTSRPSSTREAGGVGRGPPQPTMPSTAAAMNRSGAERLSRKGFGEGRMKVFHIPANGLVDENSLESPLAVITVSSLW